MPATIADIQGFEILTTTTSRQVHMSANIADNIASGDSELEEVGSVSVVINGKSILPADHVKVLGCGVGRIIEDKATCCKERK